MLLLLHLGGGAHPLVLELDPQLLAGLFVPGLLEESPPLFVVVFHHHRRRTFVVEVVSDSPLVTVFQHVQSPLRALGSHFGLGDWQ